MDIQRTILNNGIIPDPQKDQFFLVDEETIKNEICQADINKNDVVLEVGAGIGNLTRELARSAGRVITFEIDKQFKPLLNDLPVNVELHFEDAWDYIQLHGKWKKKKKFNKIVANLPYSFTERFLHNLTFLEYDKVILIVPLKSVNMLSSAPVFGSFFDPRLIEIIDKEKFYPVPRTNSAMIDLIKLPDPLMTKNLSLYLRQYMYQHEDQMAKNSLREGLVSYYQLTENTVITKNQAREMIRQTGISTELLAKSAHNAAIYDAVTHGFKA